MMNASQSKQTNKDPLHKGFKEESDYKDALEKSCIVSITNERGIITHVNPNFCKISKYRKSELIGQDHRIINSGFHPKDFILTLWRSLANGQIWRGKLKNKTKDGIFYWVDTMIVPSLNDAGKPYQYVSISTDITAQKETEENIEYDLKEISDYNYARDKSSTVAIADEDGVIKYASHNFSKISKYSLSELLEQHNSILNSEYHSGAFVVDLWNTLGRGEIWRGELKNKFSDDIIYWTDTSIIPFLNDQGYPYQYLVIRTDITERKKTEEKFRQSEARLKEAQALSHISNWQIDLATNVSTWSDEFYHIFGIKRDDIQPSPEAFLSLLHPEDINYAKEKVEKSYENFESSSFYTRMKTVDGSIRYLYSEWRFEFDTNERPIRLYGILQDITERKLAEIERTKMVDDLMLRNKDLEQFAYIISHNLRTPVANILGTTAELNEPGISIEEKEILRQGLNESVMKLDEVVKDLSQILQVKREISEIKEKVCFSKTVIDIKLSLKKLMDTDVKINYDFSALDELITLKSYLYSIFYNLISNSIKYRQQQIPCIIQIKSRMTTNKIELIFTDNGMGIDLQKRGDQVFGLYKRFHTSIEGKGMGLFMVKTQVEILGGHIKIKSEVNAGTEFTIDFDK